MTNFATDARDLHDTWIYPEYRRQVAHASYLGGLWIQALGAGVVAGFIPALVGEGRRRAAARRPAFTLRGPRQADGIPPRRRYRSRAPIGR